MRNWISFILAFTLTLSAFGADKKVSDLNSLPAASWQTVDSLPIIDQSAGETKKTTIGDFDTRYFQNANVLGVAHGGTGLNYILKGDFLLGTSTTSYVGFGAGCASGQFMVADGVGNWSCNGANYLLPNQSGQSGKLLTTDGTNPSWVNPAPTGVTSVGLTVPSFLSVTGSPITSTGTLAVSLSGTALPVLNGGTGQTSFSSGVLRSNGTALSSSTVSLTGDVAGTLPLANGGTGQTSASTAINALVPTQTGNAGKFLTSSGTAVSWAPAALSTQAQSEVSATSTLTLKAPNSQLTTVGTDTRLIETGNGNLLKNPNFQATSAGTDWTVVGTAATDTSVAFGLAPQSLKTTVSAVSGTILSQTLTINQNMSGINFGGQCRIYTALTNIQLCSMKNSTEQQCLPVTPSKWTPIQPTMVGDVSGTTYGLKVKSTSSATGDLNFADCYLKEDNRLGTSQTYGYVGGMKHTGSGCVGTWNENSSSGTSNFVDLTNTGCAAWTTSGPISSASGNEYKATYTNMPVGEHDITLTGPFINLAAGQTCNYRLYDGTTSYDPVTIYSAASLLTVPVLTFHVPVTSQATKTFALQASDDGSGGCGVNIANGGISTWKFDYSSPVTNAMRINQSDVPERDYGPMTIGATVTPPTKGPTRVRDSVWVTESGENARFVYDYKHVTTGGSVGSGDYLYTLPTGFAFSSKVQFYTGSGGVNASNFYAGVRTYGFAWGVPGNVKTWGVVVPYDATRFRISASYMGTSGSGFFGEGYWGSSLMDMNGTFAEFVIDFTAPIASRVGYVPSPLVSGISTTDSKTTYRVDFSAKIGQGTVSTVCNSSPCTIYQPSGDAFTSLTRSGTGTYSAGVKAGLCSTPPICPVTVAVNGINAVSVFAYTASTTSIGISVLILNTGSLADAYFDLACHCMH